MSKLGREPAFPALEHNEAGYGDCIKFNFGEVVNYLPFTKGISKRYFTACIAMNALTISKGHLLSHRKIVEEAYDLADIMLEEELDD